MQHVTRLVFYVLYVYICVLIIYVVDIVNGHTCTERDTDRQTYKQTTHECMQKANAHTLWQTRKQTHM